MIPIPREELDPPQDAPPEILRGYGTDVEYLDYIMRVKLMEELIKRRLPDSVRATLPPVDAETRQFLSTPPISNLLREQPPISKTDSVGELAELDNWARQLGTLLQTGAISQMELQIELDRLAKEWAGTSNVAKYVLIGFGILTLILLFRGK